MPGILFDFNGVIVDDEPQHCDALIATLAEYGCSLDRETYYRDYLGFDDRECFRHGFEQGGLPADPARIAEAIERKAVHYEAAIRRSLALVPGVVEFIRAAAADDYRLAIASGALRREIELVLSTAGVRQHFDAIVAAEDVSACKPDPEGFGRARTALDLPPDRCLVVEDSLPGLAAARAAGIRCAMVTTSHPADLLASADAIWPDFTGRHPRELPWAND